MNRKNSEERFLAPPTPAVSPPRNDDDFDDSKLIYGPATPYVQGVSEPEPDIPLRDNENSINTGPKSNHTQHNQCTSSTNSHQVHVPNRRVDSSATQSIPSNNSRMSYRNDINSINVERSSQIQYQKSAQQQSMPPPSLRRFHVDNSIHGGDNRFTNSQYPTMTISSNSFRNQSQNVNSVTQNQSYSHTQVARVPPSEPQVNYQTQIPMQNSRHQYLNSNVNNTTIHPTQNSLQRVAAAPIPIQRYRFPFAASNPNQVQPMPVHQQRVSSHVIGPCAQVQNSPFQPSSFIQHPAYRNASAEQQHNQCNINYQQWENEIQAAWLQIQIFWARDPRGLKPFITNVMRQSPKDRRKWDSWWRYFQYYETRIQMVQSEATQDTIKMTKKVAELIDSTWLAWNGCHLGQQSYLQTRQQATYLQTTVSDPVSHNYQQPFRQHIPNNASINNDVPPPSATSIASSRENAIPQQTLSEVNRRSSASKSFASISNQMENINGTSGMSKTERLQNYVYATTESQSDKLMLSSDQIRAEQQVENFVTAQELPITNIQQSKEKSIFPLSISKCQNNVPGIDMISPPAGFSASGQFSYSGVSSTDSISKETSVDNSASNPLQYRQNSPHQTISRPSTQPGPQDVSSTVMGSLIKENQEKSTVPKDAVNNKDEPCPMEQDDDVQVITENPRNQSDEVYIIRKKHHQPPPNFEKSRKQDSTSSINRSPSNSIISSSQDKLTQRPVLKIAAEHRLTPTLTSHLRTSQKEGKIYESETSHSPAKKARIALDVIDKTKNVSNSTQQNSLEEFINTNSISSMSKNEGYVSMTPNCSVQNSHPLCEKTSKTHHLNHLSRDLILSSEKVPIARRGSSNDLTDISCVPGNKQMNAKDISTNKTSGETLSEKESNPVISLSYSVALENSLPNVTERVQSNNISSNSTGVNESRQLVSPNKDLDRPSSNKSPEASDRKMASRNLLKQVFASLEKKKNKVLTNTMGVGNISPKVSSSSIESSSDSIKKSSGDQEGSDHLPHEVMSPNKVDEKSILRNVGDFFMQLIQDYNDNLQIRKLVANEIQSFLDEISFNNDAPSIFINKMLVGLPGFKEKVTNDQQEMFIKCCIELRQQHGEWFSRMYGFLRQEYPNLFFNSDLSVRNMPTIDTPVVRLTVKNPFKSPPIPSNSRHSNLKKVEKSPDKNYEAGNNSQVKNVKKQIQSPNNENSLKAAKSALKSTSNSKQKAQKSKTLEQRAQKCNIQVKHAQNKTCSSTKPREELIKLKYDSKEHKINSKPSTNTMQSNNKSEVCIQSASTPDVSFFHPNKHQTKYHLLEHGDLYIQAVPYQKKFLLNSVTLGYKLILVTNSQHEVPGKEIANQEHYFIILAPLSIVNESISNKKGELVRCAFIDKTDQNYGTELRFSVPTLTGYQIIDCLDYSSRQDGTKNLWHTFQHAPERNNIGLFLKFIQYAEVCRHIEEKYHYQFPQYLPSSLCPKIHNLLQTNVWGTAKSGHFFRRQNTIRFYEHNEKGLEVGNVDFVALVFNKNVIFVPMKIWTNFFYAAFKDAIFGEECYDVRLLKRNKKTSFKIRFRKESLIMLEAEIVQDQMATQQKIKDSKPFCVVRGNSFGNLKFPLHSIIGRPNEVINDYNMHRRIWGKCYIKAKRKSTIKHFTIYYLDIFDEYESKEMVLEPNSMNETIGRSITMLIVPEACQEQVETFNFSSDRIIMTRPTADNAIWMLIDKGTTQAPQPSTPTIMTKKVIRGRFITNLKYEHKDSQEAKCWCSRCAKDRLKNNFRTDLLFLSSDLLYDFIRPYEILDWKSEKKDSVTMPDFKMLHPGVKEHLSSEVMRSAENFQNNVNCLKSSNQGISEETMQSTILSPLREALNHSAKLNNSVLNSMASHKILKNLEAPLKRRHSTPDSAKDTIDSDSLNRNSLSPSMRSVSLIDSDVCLKSPCRNKVGSKDTRTHSKQKESKSKPKNVRFQLQKGTRFHGSKELTSSSKNTHESLRQKLNKDITMIKPINKKCSSTIKAQKLIKRSKENLVKKESKTRKTSLHIRKRTSSTENKKSRPDTSKYSHKKFRKNYDKNQTKNVSIHANVNICQAKDNFCKAIESNEKNDRFVTHPVNDSSQPKPSGPNQANEENRSSIVYPIEDIKKDFISPDLLRARKNILRFMNNDNNNRAMFYDQVVELKQKMFQVFHNNRVDLKKYLAISIEKEAQNKAIIQFEKESKLKGIITPRDITLGRVSEDMLGLHNERRNSSDSDSGVDVSIEGLSTGIDPPKLAANPITCNLCATNNVYESEDALWLHQKSSHLSKNMTEENVFPVACHQDDNYYLIEENVGPDMTKFEHCEPIIDDNSSHCPVWVCFECNPPCLLSEEKFDDHAEDFLHFEQVIHFDNEQQAKFAIDNHFEK